MDSMTPIENTLTSARVSEAIRRAIFAGQLKPGHKIAQDVLAEQLGVSRMPIREALMQLAAEGLVTLEPRRGAWVAPLTLETIEEAYGLRGWLEPKAVELSVPRLTVDDIERLSHQVVTMTDAENDNDAQRFVATNREFHQTLRTRCAWSKLNGIVDMLWNGFPPLTPQFVAEQMAEDRSEHEALWQAAKDRDGHRAAEVMAQHIYRSGIRAREYFQNLGWIEAAPEQSGRQRRDGHFLGGTIL